MPRDAEVIRRCIAECIAAPSGHGRRWAVARCKSALQSPAASPAIVEATAAAARAVAEVLIKSSSNNGAPHGR